jgi:hypothetical protein
LYNKLKFFVEDQIYWAPASTTSDLYSQLASKKYREIPRNQIMLVSTQNPTNLLPSKTIFFPNNLKPHKLYFSAAYFLFQFH